MRTYGLESAIIQRVTLLLEADEFERLESYCERRGYKKSPLIARLLRDHLDQEGFFVQQSLPLDRAVRRELQPHHRRVGRRRR